MHIRNIPFNVIDWEKIPEEEHSGTDGTAYWKVIKQDDIRARVVRYTPGYIADHWCEKGHVIYVLEGEFTSELKDGRKFVLTKGMGYLVADGMDAHTSYTKDGVTLFIVD